MLKKIVLIILISLSWGLIQPVPAQVVNNLNDVRVWTFGPVVWNDSTVNAAVYINPQYVKRAWFKYSSMPGNPFTDPLYGLWEFPPELNARGALFEGGVQVAQLTIEGGWPCDNPYDDDHIYPFEIPEPVYDDFVTLNADGEIYYQPSPFDFTITNGIIANENYLDYCLYWAFEQLDANVNALEFDEIDGAYKLSLDADSSNNKNIGYDDYTIGTANFATKLSVVFGHGYIDPVEWFMPEASASSMNDSAQLAFDDDFATFWHSEVGDSHWVEIDFGRIRTIKQVYLRFPTEHILDSFHAVYWEGSSWQDFDPPVFHIGNTDSIRSFLVEPVPAEKVLLFSTDSVAYISEMQLFGQGFRQFLLARYCDSLGWASSDPRWETEKLIDLSDTIQCPDGTMNSFNYRKYLQANDWTLNPFGGELTWDNILYPPNKLFLDWFPSDYYHLLWLLVFSEDVWVATIQDLIEESFMYELIFSTWWRRVTDSSLAYAASLERDVYITYNGSAYILPHYVDYMLAPMGDCLTFPAYHCSTATDTSKICLIGDQAQINIWRLLKRRAVEYLGEEVPIVAFCDFWQLGMPFAHLGGIDEPADQRAIYLLTYAMEMRAAGVNFCFPVHEAEENAWEDTLSDGTPLIEIMKQQADFLNAYDCIYRNVIMSYYETMVTVNGVVPFNGEWNIDWDSGLNFNSPVNESKVTIAYMDKDDGTQSYLHIINHNWDDENHEMLPQIDVPVQIPAQNTCEQVSVVSPDFTDTLSVPFVYEENVITLTMPELEYYNVIVLDWVTASTFNISGNMGYYSDASPIPDAELELTGDGTYSTTTNTSGDYIFNDIPGGNYISTPSKADDLGGLSGTDASRIARYVADLYSFDCLEMIAGDVSMNGFISGMDASRVARYAADLITELNGDCIDWVFAPEPIPECNDWPPIVYENTREYTPLESDLIDEDFIGIRLGDVSGNWAPDSRKILSYETFESTEIETNINSTLKIPIVIEEVTAIEGIDISITFDLEVLHLTELTLKDGILAEQNYAVETNLKDGKIVIYALSDLVSETGTVAFIEFDIIGAVGSKIDVYFTRFDVNETEASGGLQLVDSE
nr:hypothetical protein [Candidatus Cloacimonadota bacterium]